MPTYFSPSKINLFLRVLGKREDGFHELSTALQTLSLGDTLIVEGSDREEFSCSREGLPMDESNLVIRALRLFQSRTEWYKPFNVHLEKRIPHEAGLGGGSSNAATMLWALNELSGLELPESTLRSWGAELGSDVPFFFSCGTALCEGRGEKVRDLSRVDLPPITLVKPSLGLSTPAVFRNLLLSECSSLTPRELLDQLGSSRAWVNDLSSPAYRLAPQLDELERRLLSVGYEDVMMSGSGTTMVCLGAGAPWKEEGLQFYKVKSVGRELGGWYCEAGAV